MILGRQSKKLGVPGRTILWIVKAVQEIAPTDREPFCRHGVAQPAHYRVQLTLPIAVSMRSMHRLSVFLSKGEQIWPAKVQDLTTNSNNKSPIFKKRYVEGGGVM